MVGIIAGISIFNIWGDLKDSGGLKESGLKNPCDIYIEDVSRIFRVLQDLFPKIWRKNSNIFNGRCFL